MDTMRALFLYGPQIMDLILTMLFTRVTNDELDLDYFYMGHK